MYQWYILNPLKGWIWIQTLTKIWVSPLMLPWLPHDMFTYRHLPTRSPTYIYLKQIHFTVFFKSVQRATWLSALTCGAPCNTFPVGSLSAAFESITHLGSRFKFKTHSYRSIARWWFYFHQCAHFTNRTQYCCGPGVGGEERPLDGAVGPFPTEHPE